MMVDTFRNALEDVSLLTNEEKRVPIYLDKGRPTTSANVTPDTPLNSLNLSWREKELPEKERTKHVHRLHPYLGKFVPQLAEVFLRKYFTPGQTVLDPFCGSGTALVQANELGLNSIGYDVSVFNIMLCRAKLRKYDVSKAKHEVLDILARFSDLIESDTIQSILWQKKSDRFNLPELDSQYLNEWFAPRALKELLAYRYLIETGGYEYRDLLKVILSRSARSARLTTHFDLDFPKRPQTEPYWCYKHSRQCSPTTEAMKFIKRYSLDTLRRIEEFSLYRTNAKTIIRHADSRLAKFPPIDGVITSPPYVGLIDYHEQHTYAYHLLGLTDRRVSEIGAAANGSSKRARQEYQKGIAKVFRKAVDAMSTGGRLIVVAHDRSRLYDEIARLCDVEVEATLERHVNRRTGRRSNEFFESIFIWRKL